MYRLIYKGITGSQGEENVDEHSIWLEGEPTQADKDHFISGLIAQGKLPERDLDKAHTKRYESYNKTVMVSKDNELEVVYKRKEARDITFYSDGTYSIDEGTSHNYNEDYFKFEGPYSNDKLESEEVYSKDVEIAKIHAASAVRVAEINAETNEKIARINE